ncbi:hypothetical protein BGX28_008765 [Mortierella sp. GBA30]|nr:hypothetical protein BGX28_008765 [Mortierella sp. GBA30]
MTTDNTASAHGLLLIRISDMDAPLGDSFHAIQRALVLVHRLTVVVSVPSLQKSSTTSGLHQNHSTGSSDRTSKAGSETQTKKTDSNSIPANASFHCVQRLLSAIYVSFTKQAMALQRPLAELDVVFQHSCGYDIGTGADDEIPFDILLGTSEVTTALNELNAKRSMLGQKILPVFTLDLSTPHTDVYTHLVEAIDSALPYSKDQEGEYRDVALGGTFDHLHAGHKILLSMTAWITSHRVVCGVTDDSMLKSKKFKEYMEPLDKRIHAVERFLRIFKRGLIYEVVPIHDIYGPTITDDKLQALMVSTETLKGGAAVNEERANRKLPPLEIEVINVISPTQTQVDEVSLKISSTFIRQYLSEHPTQAIIEADRISGTRTSSQ